MTRTIIIKPGFEFYDESNGEYLTFKRHNGSGLCDFDVVSTEFDDDENEIEVKSERRLTTSELRVMLRAKYVIPKNYNELDDNDK